MKNIEETIQLETLDCTLRDGGYINNWEFSDEEVLSCYEAVSLSGIDYFEIGFKSKKESATPKGIWWHSTDEDINRIYDKYQNSKRCKIAAMIYVEYDSLDYFLPKSDSKIDLVRILVGHNNPLRLEDIDRKQAQKCKELSQGLLDLGYEVAVNIACIDKIYKSKLDILFEELRDIQLKCVYIADTYGALDEVSVLEHVDRVAAYGLKVGVHTHNNQNDALSKTKSALNCSNVSMVDSCIGGLGRGAGNCNSELLALYLSKKIPNKYNADPLIIHYDKYIRSSSEYLSNKLCYSYHPLYAYAAHFSIHPDFVDDLIKDLKIKMPEKIKLLRDIYHHCYSTNKYSYDKNLVNDFSKKINL
jgi:4-hydroxy 2-oxovalerate aldolase